MNEPLPPHAQLIQMGTACWISKIVYAAARTGLADQLAAGPRSAVEFTRVVPTESAVGIVEAVPA